MIAFRLHLAQMHHVDRAGREFLLPRLFGVERAFLVDPLGVGEAAEVNGAASVIVLVERRERERRGADDRCRLDTPLAVHRPV